MFVCLRVFSSTFFAVIYTPTNLRTSGWFFGVYLLHCAANSEPKPKSRALWPKPNNSISSATWKQQQQPKKNKKQSLLIANPPLSKTKNRTEKLKERQRDTDGILLPNSVFPSFITHATWIESTTPGQSVNSSANSYQLRGKFLVDLRRSSWKSMIDRNIWLRPITSSLHLCCSCLSLSFFISLSLSSLFVFVSPATASDSLSIMSHVI